VRNLSKSFPKASIIGEESDESLAEDNDLESLIAGAPVIDANSVHPFPEILTKEASAGIKSISEDEVTGTYAIFVYTFLFFPDSMREFLLLTGRHLGRSFGRYS